ncbi:hypothetical protein P168DRAFT_322131 [Aspergillus campestris IBT 28561]|uniref:Uncharacterized protein n=1 Tax=Aspergillus campestris (strain IBT 28561) TaxID=1392248 RepID=A0A2I1CSC2_ASPC2|nr:uncharacterized protein P168DRAFT_322131 [Aspergillus campestris IBT 28561]PKY00519.1 hypothetical protein P168DRAFT_322131 [Aspergillus campestris IBT 28561]
MAQICDMPEIWERSGFTAYNQTELDIIARSCTIFNGNLHVHESFTGRFYLPNVRHIVGHLGLHIYDEPNDGQPRPKLTSFELPDLETVDGGVSLIGMSGLKSISMPKLRSVDWHVGADAAEEVDLRSLEAVGTIDIGGALSTLRLDALEEAEKHLVISKECEDVPPTPALAVFLPSLTKAGDIQLKGRFSRVAMPQLSNISFGDSPWSSFELDACGGPPFEVSLPQLAHVSMDMDISGGIQSLSIPSLKNMTSPFRLNTTEQLDLTLPFVEADAVKLYGNLTSIEFPNLHVAASINVSSTVPFDCGALKKSVDPAIQGPKDWHNKCTAPAGPGLSPAAKIGIGVGVGVGGLVVIAAGLWFFLRRRKQTKRLKSESIAHIQDMPPSYAETRNQDHPPEYASTHAR